MSASTSQFSPAHASIRGGASFQAITGLWGLWLFLVLACAPLACSGTGVTLITHGYNSNVDDWVRAMADEIPIY